MAEDQPPLPPDVTGPPGSPPPPEPLWPTADPPDEVMPAPAPPPPPPPAVAPAIAPPAAPPRPGSGSPPAFGLPSSVAPAPYRQPSVSELTKPSRGRRVGLTFVIVGVIVLVVGGSAAGFLLTRSTGSKASHLGATTPSASAAEVSPTPAQTPNTVSYTDPDAYYTAQFSKAPAYHSTTQASPVGNVPYRYAEYIGPDVDQLVGVLVFAPGTGFDTQKGLQGIATAGKGSVISSAPSTFQGYPSLEGVISLQGDYLKVQIVHVGNLAYIIWTAGPVNPPSDYAGFIAGVHITPH